MVDPGHVVDWNDGDVPGAPAAVTDGELRVRIESEAFDARLVGPDAAAVATALGPYGHPFMYNLLPEWETGPCDADVRRRGQARRIADLKAQG